MKTVAHLKAAPYNPRRIGKAQLAALGQSLKEFGDMGGIVFNRKTGHIVGGHQRVKQLDPSWAIELLGEEGKQDDTCAWGWIHTPFGKLSYREVNWPIEKEQAANIAANAHGGEFDLDLLKPIVNEVKIKGVNLDLLGLDKSITDKIAPAASEEKLDKAEEDLVGKLPARVKPGEIWQLGAHQLYCGDCTHVILKDFLGESPVDMILTDPPYCSGGFQESGRAGGSIGTNAKIQPKIANDTLSTRGYQALMKRAIFGVNALSAYVFTDWRMWVHLFDVAEESGYGVRSMIVWNKETPGMGMGWRTQHELVMFATRSAIKFDNHKAVGNVITTKRTGNPDHPTQKPVEIVTKVLEVMDMADTVYDPFAGSGTTLLGCEIANRKCLAVEIEPNFCDVIIARWEQFTGHKATVKR